MTLPHQYETISRLKYIFPTNQIIVRDCTASRIRNTKASCDCSVFEERMNFDYFILNLIGKPYVLFVAIPRKYWSTVTLADSRVLNSTEYTYQVSPLSKSNDKHFSTFKYEGWNFNFGNIPLDWIQELLEWRANAAGRMGPSPTYIHNGSGPSWNGHTQ